LAFLFDKIALRASFAARNEGWKSPILCVLGN
jgi:hypothetical protein